MIDDELAKRLDKIDGELEQLSVGHSEHTEALDWIVKNQTRILAAASVLGAAVASAVTAYFSLRGH